MTIDPRKLEAAINLECRHDIDRSMACIDSDAFWLLREAAEAHLATLPREREINVWHVEYSIDGAPCIALFELNSSAHALADTPSWREGKSCVRVTGPHKHLVTA